MAVNFYFVSRTNTGQKMHRVKTTVLRRSVGAGRTFSSGKQDGFAKFATHIMRCNQKCFDRVADDLEARQLPQGARILDLGASAGEPSLTIASRPSGFYVVSTDFAPPNVELGVARAKAFGLSNSAEFHTTDAQDLSAWADGSFDAAVGTYVLMFTPDVEKVCRSCHVY